jgi:CRP-like cAMP-binding protein
VLILTQTLLSQEVYFVPVLTIASCILFLPKIAACMKELLRQIMSQTIPIANDEWEALEPHIHSKKIKKRTSLLQKGQVSNQIGLIVSGSFRQYYLIDGVEKTTFFFFEHSFVCDYDSFLTQRPCDHYIEALEDSEILYFDRETLLRMYRIYPKFETFGRLIAENVYLCVKERLGNFLLDTPEGRYKHFINSYEAERILQRVPQHYIASYLGMTPVSLSRIRSRVQKQLAVQPLP